jgi:hypothetical protein
MSGLITAVVASTVVTGALASDAQSDAAESASDAQVKAV